MLRPERLALAVAADALFGDPAWFPHPVRAFGLASALGERLVRGVAQGSPSLERLGGTALCAGVVAGTLVGSASLLAAARRRDARLGALLEVGLAWTTLAMRGLLSESGAVLAALRADDLPRARRRVARIVGRDTAALDASDVARAAIETLAESYCDGIVAPLCALAFGGVPLALAFKAASTLDSMIGHLEPPYTRLGRASAKLDDALCWLPARAGALALVVCAPAARGSWRRAIATLARDGRKHRSPNAGRCEAAAAGALGVRLGGPNSYGGVAHDAQRLGAEFDPPQARDVARAQRLVACASLLAAACAFGFSCAAHRLE